MRLLCSCGPERARPSMMTLSFQDIIICIWEATHVESVTVSGIYAGISCMGMVSVILNI